MTLQISGPISLGDIANELGRPGTLVSFNDADVRALIGSTAGTLITMSDFYGASAVNEPSLLDAGTDGATAAGFSVGAAGGGGDPQYGTWDEGYIPAAFLLMYRVTNSFAAFFFNSVVINSGAVNVPNNDGIFTTLTIRRLAPGPGQELTVLQRSDAAYIGSGNAFGGTQWTWTLADIQNGDQAMISGENYEVIYDE